MANQKWYSSAIFVLPGMLFGAILLRSEVLSWFRIQEMFRFQSFHMYGIMGSAVAVAALSLWIIRKLGLKSAAGETIVVHPIPLKWKANVIGGLLFGLGWALIGACPGPIFVLMGYLQWPYFIVFAGAMIGVVLYGWLKDRLPH
jgi:uncharacterized protein